MIEDKPYRGKRFIDGQWVYGYYVDFDHMACIFTGKICVKDFDTDIGRIALETPEFFICDPSSITQNTIRETRDGVPVYVGDKIRAETIDGTTIVGVVDKETNIAYVVRYPNGAIFYLKDLYRIDFMD